jgi:flagellar P-ring protein precursor FlgI
MEQDVFTPFVQEGYVTLVIDKNHANFQTTADIVTTIRQRPFFQNDDSAVRAVNAANIVVKVPDHLRTDPVDFVASLMETEIYRPEPESRVVIDQRTGSIVIDGDVQIGEVVISHRNIVVEATAPVERFVPFDTQHQDASRLKALVDALNALKVPNEDAIAIIKGIDRSGKLHARLIIDQ